MGWGGYWNSRVISLAFCLPMLVKAWVDAAFCPGYVSGFELNMRRTLAFDVAAQIEIGHGHNQVRAGVVVFGDNAAGLQFEIGDAHAVVDEQDVAGAAVEDVQCLFISIHSPFGRGRVAGFLVLQEFDDHVAVVRSDRFLPKWEKPPGTKWVSPSCSVSLTGGFPATSFSTCDIPRVTEM